MALDGKANVIAKHTIDLSKRSRVKIPMSSKGRVIHVGHQSGNIMALQLWVQDVEFPASLTPEDEPIERIYYVVGTGAYFPSHWVHQGTVILSEVGFVWHVYEDPDPTKTEDQ